MSWVPLLWSSSPDGAARSAPRAPAVTSAGAGPEPGPGTQSRAGPPPMELDYLSAVSLPACPQLSVGVSLIHTCTASAGIW